MFPVMACVLLCRGGVGDGLLLLASKARSGGARCCRLCASASTPHTPPKQEDRELRKPGPPPVKLRRC